MNNNTKLNNSSPINIDVKGYVFKVLAYWQLFLATILIAFIVARFMNGYKQKKYSLDTTISVKEETNPLFTTGTNIAFNWGGASDEVETVKVILTSRSHNEKVVDSLNFFVDYFKEGKYRLVDVYGYTPFVISLDSLNKTMPQIYNKLIEFDITGEDTFKLSFDFSELNTNKLITYKNNRFSNYISNTATFSKEFKVNKKINTPFLNFKVIKTGNFNIGDKFYIRFSNFDGTVKSNRYV